MELNENELLKIIEYFCCANAEKTENTYELEIEIMRKLSYIENRLDELTNNNMNDLLD